MRTTRQTNTIACGKIIANIIRSTQTSIGEECVCVRPCPRSMRATTRFYISSTGIRLMLSISYSTQSSIGGERRRAHRALSRVQPFWPGNGSNDNINNNKNNGNDIVGIGTGSSALCVRIQNENNCKRRTASRIAIKTFRVPVVGGERMNGNMPYIVISVLLLLCPHLYVSMFNVQWSGQ